MLTTGRNNGLALPALSAAEGSEVEGDVGEVADFDARSLWLSRHGTHRNKSRFGSKWPGLKAAASSRVRRTYSFSHITFTEVIASEAKQPHSKPGIATPFGLAMTRALLKQFRETQ
jgi:hypothetical protein